MLQMSPLEIEVSLGDGTAQVHQYISLIKMLLYTKNENVKL